MLRFFLLLLILLLVSAGVLCYIPPPAPSKKKETPTKLKEVVLPEGISLPSSSHETLFPFEPEVPTFSSDSSSTPWILEVRDPRCQTCAFCAGADWLLPIRQKVNHAFFESEKGLEKESASPPVLEKKP
jgi:hypothetical protein